MATQRVTTLAFAILSPLLLAAQAPGRALSAVDKQLLDKALTAYDAGDLKGSEPVLRALAARYPKSYLINEALGGLYSEAGQPSQSLRFLEHATRLSPQEALAHANLGATYLKLARTGEAITELKLAATLDPANVATRAMLGQAWMAAGKPALAVEAFAAVEKLHPGEPDNLYNWALALQAAGSLREAAAVLQRVPNEAQTAETASLAGELAEQLGDFKSAVIADQNALRLDPSANNTYALTLELLRHWTWSEALTVARSGQVRFPHDQRFATAAGIALYADAKYGAAAVEFSSLLHLNPDNASYADLLGRSCEAAGDEAIAACRELDAFASAHPRNARVAVFVAAHILHNPLDQQDTPRAEALLRQALDADPQLPEAYFQLAVLKQQQTHWQDSVAPLEKAIALRPRYAEAHFRLSRAYAHVGRREDALHEIALQQEYSQAEKERLNSRMQEMVRFVLTPGDTTEGKDK